MKHPLIEPLEARIAPATFSIVSLAVSTPEGDAGTKNLDFTVRLAGAITSDATIHFSTFDGTATTADSDYTATSGTLTFHPGPQNQTQVIHVPIIGDTKQEADETFTLTLDAPTGAVLSTTSATATGTILNDDLSVLISDVRLNEGNANSKTMDFTVSLSAPTLQPVTVTLATADGTATAGSDYLATNATLTFNPGGPTTQKFPVPIFGDTIDENDETFFVNLSGVTNAKLDKTQVTGTILNDDRQLSVSDVSIQETDGDTTMNFVVSLSSASSHSVSVDYLTADSNPVSATAGTDYTAIPKTTLTFLPGETTKTVSVAVHGDTIDEPNETFLLNLINPVNAVISHAQATGTILNDDATVQISDMKVLEGGPGAVSHMDFTVSLAHPSTRQVSVDLATADGTATAGSDYTPAAATFTFLPGETSKTFSVPIIGDAVDENDETILVNLSNVTNATLSKTQATGTILNDDLRLTVDDATVVEGSSGTRTLDFVLHLSTPSAHAVVVQFATQDGTALAASDYVSQTGAVTFAPGEVAKTVSVVVNGDTVGENDESLLLNLSGVSGALLTRAQATGTILNDDAAVRIGDVQVIEGATGTTTNAVFTVTLDHGPATGDVTVDYVTADGTAKATDGGSTPVKDYTALAKATLTFHAGETTKTISVPVIGDANVEANETFFVKLSGATNATVVNDTGTGTIINDDGAIFTINDVTVTEGDAGTANAVFLVSLLSPANGNVTVDVKTVNGSAVQDGATPDFDSVTKTLTFSGQVTQQLVSVPIHGDLMKEGTETFNVVLSNVTGTASIFKSTGVGTILDNNDPAPTVSIGDSTLVEGNSGTGYMIFTATLSQPSGSPVTVSFSTQDGTGAHAATAADNDYTAVTGQTITFAPGETKATIAVPIIGDTKDEGDETFGVAISNPIGALLGTAVAKGTIQSDETLLSIGNVTLNEGNSGTTSFTFTVTASQLPVGHDVTVNFSTADDTAISTGANADYTAKSGTVTFTPTGSLTQQVTVVVSGDTRIEANEQFFVNLTGAANGTIAIGQGIGKITNDDGTPKITIQDAQIIEGDSGTSPMTFNVTLDKASDLPVTVRVNSADGTALAGATKDYLALAEQTLTFAPGEVSKTVTVNVVGDLVDEPTETFSVKLSSATNAIIDRDTGTGTIIDNDQALISVADVSIVEGDSGAKDLTFNLVLSKSATQTVMVDYATVDGSAVAGPDYVQKNGTATFTPGTTSVSVKVTINGDTLVEGNERFFLQLQNAVNGRLDINTSKAAGIIVDDESTVKLSPVGGLSVAEDGGTFAEFQVVREGDLSQPVSVDFTTVDNTTTSTGPLADYTPVNGTITFAAGSSVASGTIKVAIIGDNNYENDETFRVQLSNPTNAAVLAQGAKGTTGYETVTILKGNDAPPTVSIEDAQIVEGDSGQSAMEFKVRLSAANEVDSVSVDYKTIESTVPVTLPDGTTLPNALGEADTVNNLLQDYVPQTLTTLSFTPGQTEQTIRVNINGDTRNESPKEVFRVQISNAVHATSITRDTAFGTIIDNDPVPTISFETPSQTNQTPLTFTEGDGGTTDAKIKLVLSEVSEQPLSVQITTRDGTAVSVLPFPDFTGLDRHVVNYIPGTAKDQFFVSIPIIGDTMHELTESFTVSLSDPLMATITGNATATVTINDNDPVPVISVNDVSISEGNAGTTDMIFNVSLSAASGQTVKVNFATADGTATSKGALADYIAKSGALKFLPGETSKQVHVQVIGDTYKEANETFTVNLSAAENATILSAAGTGTILDDGDTKVGISIGNAFLVEGDSGTSTMNFTVELTSAQTTDTTFSAFTTNGTAVKGSDYAALNGLSVTIPANSKTATVAVTINGDQTFEPTENFFVSLRNVPAGITVVNGTGQGTIFNDDTRQVDSQTVQFIDVDGDLVTAHVSVGTLPLSSLTFGATNAIGGRQLQSINLIASGPQNQGADLSVIATHQPGFHGDANGVKADGFVNVGFIQAAIVDSSILQVTNGIDLGNVTIDGDLGRIYVGDIFATAAMKSLTVQSLGVQPASKTQATPTDGSSPSVASLVLGPIDNLRVFGDVGGTLNVLGDQFGLIKNLEIEGALRGGTTADSGEIFFTGRVKTGYIGKIIGGSGTSATSSGRLTGSTSTNATIGKLTVGEIVGGDATGSGIVSASEITTLKVGSITGGSGSQTGLVNASTIETVVVKHDLTGGSGQNSGELFTGTRYGTVEIRGKVIGGGGATSGVVASVGTIDKLSVFGGLFGGAGGGSGGVQATGAVTLAGIGGIFGGAGADSGKFRAGGAVQTINVFGDIVGGSGQASGAIESNATLVNVQISGSIIGGSSVPGASLFKTGYVAAHKIDSLYLNGNLESGQNNGTGLTMSGTIRAEVALGTVHIHGSVLGNAGAAAIIAAPGNGGNRAAIDVLRIDGSARFAEILGGYGLSTAVAETRGAPSNGDARIGTVKIFGDMQSTSIVAGGTAGNDGIFGSNDDGRITGTGTTDEIGVYSKIARIVIGGRVESGTTSAGIEAQFVKSVTANGQAFALNIGPGTDGARDRELVPGSKIQVFELPLV